MADWMGWFLDNRIYFYILYALAFGASLLAFARNSMIWLRSLMIVSSCSFIIYYFAFPAEPLWLDMSTEFLYIILNVINLVLLLRQRREFYFSEEAKNLYTAYFQGFSPFEYHKLMQAGRWETLPADSVLTTEGKEVQRLVFLYDGMVDVQKGDISVAELGAGTFIGEISFTLGKAATATVKCLLPTRVLGWDQQELHAFLARNPGMKPKFENMIAGDLARKLTP